MPVLQFPSHSKGFNGFSSTEMLMLIVIVAILIGLSFPMFGRYQAMAESGGCVGNLRKLGAAIHLYAADHDGYLPEAAAASLTAKLGTLEELLEPYIGPWVDKARLIASDGFYCPTNVRLGSPPKEGFLLDGDGRGRYKGWSGYMIGYAINAAVHPIHRLEQGEWPKVRLSQIRVPSKTLSLADMNSRPASGSIPAKAFTSSHFFDPARLQPTTFGGVHSGWCHVLFVDGHVDRYPISQPLPVISLPDREVPWYP